MKKNGDLAAHGVFFICMLEHRVSMAMARPFLRPSRDRHSCGAAHSDGVEWARVSSLDGEEGLCKADHIDRRPSHGGTPIMEHCK